MLVDDLVMYPTLMCFPDSPAYPCRGVSALTVTPGYVDPWGRHRHYGSSGGHSLPNPHHHVRVAPNPPCMVVAESWKGLADYNNPKGTIEEPLLPKDPRMWGRDDVIHWLIHMTKVHRLPPIHTDRFLMNGKALCLMTMEMFVKRVPLGGKLLYKDFRLRLSSAIYS